MTKENDSGWNGFVLEKDGKSNCLLKKDEETYCIVLKAEGDDEVKEGHFRADFQGKYRINGRTCQPVNISGSPDAPGPWRGRIVVVWKHTFAATKRMGGSYLRWKVLNVSAPND